MGKKSKAKRKIEPPAPVSVPEQKEENNLNESNELRARSTDKPAQSVVNHPSAPTKMFDWIQGAADVLSSSAIASSEDLDAVFDYHFGKLKELESVDHGYECPSINCAEPGCERVFKVAQESHLDCLKCGKIYCSNHSNNGALEMCMACWRTRRNEDVTDGGCVKSLNECFLREREKFRLYHHKEKAHLKKRLARLVLIRRETGGGESEKILQKRLVTWKNDDSTDACSFCKEAFTMLNRKSHCRLCGEIICKNCTLTVSDFKACRNCHRQLKTAEGPSSPFRDSLTKLFDDLLSTRKQILQGLPRYNEYLCNLEDELYSSPRDITRLDSIRHDALAIRNTLQIMFDNYTLLLQSISKQKTADHSQRNLVIENIAYACGIFLKLHKFSLRYLPETFDLDPTQPVMIPRGHNRSNSSSKSVSLIPSFITNFLPSLQPNNNKLEAIQEVQVPLPANLGALMQRLEILHEQKSQLETILEEARRERRFGDMTTLHVAIEEVVQEIDHVKLIQRQKQSWSTVDSDWPMKMIGPISEPIQSDFSDAPFQNPTWASKSGERCVSSPSNMTSAAAYLEEIERIDEIIAVQRKLLQNKRIPVSEAVKQMVAYVKAHRDPLLGEPDGPNPFLKKPKSGGCGCF